VIFLIAFTEGRNQDVITYLAERIDPDHLFTLMIGLVKNLYIRTKYLKKDVQKLKKSIPEIFDDEVGNNRKDRLFGVISGLCGQLRWTQDENLS
jgi:hypothetical protein